MRYNIQSPTHVEMLRTHADLDGDECPVDDICDSIPDILDYVRSLEGQIREYKSKNQNLQAQLNDANRKINNIKSQKVRHLIKKSKRGK